MKWKADCESLCLNGSKSLPRLEQHSNVKWKTFPEEAVKDEWHNQLSINAHGVEITVVQEAHTGVVFTRPHSLHNIV